MKLRIDSDSIVDTYARILQIRLNIAAFAIIGAGLVGLAIYLASPYLNH